jgi:hypothetical protein
MNKTNIDVTDSPAASLPAYVPPSIRSLGTIGELTQGIIQTSTDGFAPGSAL